MTGRTLITIGLLTIASTGTRPAAAATGSASVLYSFTGGTADGQRPAGSMVASGSNLYGMTDNGGAGNYGAIFRFNVTADAETPIYSFKGGAFASNTDGNENAGSNSLLVAGSTLYGATHEGGSGAIGMVFSYPIGSTADTTLHSFTMAGLGTDGVYPLGAVVGIGNSVYGVTQAGGGTGKSGVLYGINVTNGTETIGHAFASNTPNDGQSPVGGLVAGPNGLYYGATSGGGTANGGVVYSFNPSTNAYAVVHNFDSSNGTDGSAPYDTVIRSGNELYATTLTGGAYGYGALVQIDVPTGLTKLLYSFTYGNDGGYPMAAPTLSSHYLYGVTSQGGPGFGGYGAAYAYDLDTGNFTVLSNFDGTTGQPVGGLTVVGTTLYGVATGGANNKGAIFGVPALPVPEPAIVAPVIAALALARLPSKVRASRR